VTERQPATASELRALAHPIRLRVLREVLDAARTNAEIAERIGINPATCLHHVRSLLANGFIELDKPRASVNGITEKPYRATPKSWNTTINESPVSQRVAQAALDAFVAEASQPLADLSTSRLGVRLTNAQLHKFEKKLSVLLEEIAKADNPKGAPYAIFTAVHRRAP
jgi:DNA-binding Lrp family transcriptional regulator